MRKFIAVAVFALVAVGSMIARAEDPVVSYRRGASFAAADTVLAGATLANVALSGGAVVADSPAGGPVATLGPASLVLLGIGLLSMIGAIRRRVFRA
jgi:hypothetical protein